jgi:APA family basic amino acid/polyamine antiporter
MNYTKGLVDQFKFLILLTTLTVLIPYLFSTAAYIIFRLKEAKLTKWVRYSAIVLASLAFLFFMWMIIGSGQEIVYWGFVLCMSSIPVYVLGVVKRNQQNN